MSAHSEAKNILRFGSPPASRLTDAHRADGKRGIEKARRALHEGIYDDKAVHDDDEF